MTEKTIFANRLISVRGIFYKLSTKLLYNSSILYPKSNMDKI